MPTDQKHNKKGAGAKRRPIIRETRWRNRLKQWRLAACKSVAKTAAEFGVSEYVYMKWECCESEPPATPFLRIPEVLGVPEDEAFRRELVAVTPTE